jgi:LL-diaminopimelate aminotransferase
LSINLEYSERLKSLPPYIFAEIAAMKREQIRNNVDLISMDVGDPDIPTPQLIVDTLIEEVQKPENHKYPARQGEPDFLKAVADWYEKRFHVEIDPQNQIINLLGAKEGLVNIARAYTNPGDVILVPNPAYPVYENGATILNGAIPFFMPLQEEKKFLPDFDLIPKDIIKKAKLMYLNYPNNPTGAIPTKSFLKEAVHFADTNNILLVYDNPYSEFTFDDYIAPSLLEFTSNHVEMNSCSKIFNMTGWRIGFAAGNPSIIEGLRKIKAQIDTGCPKFIQRAAIKGFQEYTGPDKPSIVKDTIKIYEQRRNVLVEGLNAIGWTTHKPEATFYIWTKSPEPDSMKMCKRLLDIGVATTPGIGFGRCGEGYIRFALTEPIKRIKEALDRISTIL